VYVKQITQVTYTPTGLTDAAAAVRKKYCPSVYFQRMTKETRRPFLGDGYK